MAPSIGLNLRVTGHCNQGGRKYMEDVFSVAYQQTEDEMDLEYAFFGIFDGHGGKEAAVFAKEHLMDNITKQQNFWSEDDDLVLKAIREGFLTTQQAMWADLENWTKTATGLPSTAGTTASIAFIRRGKIFVGHVGDSGIILGEQDEKNPHIWRASRLTQDHKPEDEKELARIEAAGGKVVNKSGVPRVVWNRPKVGHKGPVRRSTPIDEIPFLAVGRALGDLWSYNSKKDVFVVSPDPDLHVYPIDINTNRCLILGTDGCWNVLSPEITVSAVAQAEKNNERHMIDPTGGHTWVNPSKKLVDMGVDRWKACKLRADNTSVVVVMLDPPGPPRAQVLRRQRDQNLGVVTKKLPCNNAGAPPLPPKPKPAKGLAIISRFPNSKRDEEKNGKNLVKSLAKPEDVEDSEAVKDPGMSRIVHDSMKTEPHKVRVAAVPSETSPSRTVVTTSPLPLQENIAAASSSKASTSKLATRSPCASSTAAPVQVNQVSTSDDEGESSSSSKYVTRVPSESHHPAQPPTSRKSLSRELASLQLDSPAGPAKGARSRELASLQLDSPVKGSKPRRSDAGRKSSTGVPALRRRGRSINPTAIGSDAGSDAENQEEMVPASKLIQMEKKCAALNNKIKSMEKRVADKTDALSQEVQMLKSSLNTEPLTATTPNFRALRSRNGGEPTTPPSGTKRKRDVCEGVAPSKKPTRERTLTCPGAGGRNLPSRQTRRSVGAALGAPGGAKLRKNLLKK